MNKSVVAVLCIATLSSATVPAGADTTDDRLASALNLVEVWLDAQVAYDNLPGMSVAIARDQEIVWSGGFGYANVERKQPAKADTIYSICSISKLFTTTAVMQLRDQGKLRLDEPIEKYLPWFKIVQRFEDSGPITLEGLLTHSSGLPREAGFPYWSDRTFPTQEEIISRVATLETVYPAERYFQYSNLGMTLAGEIVSAVSGEPYAQYVTSNVIDPLNLHDTTPEIPREQEGRRLAIGYAARSRTGTHAPLPFFEVKGLAPAAGFASTAEDLARFAMWQFRLLKNGGREVLSANTLRQMQRAHWVNDTWNGARGFGFAVTRQDGKTYVGHDGNCPGYRTQLSLWPDDKIAVVVLINTEAVNPGAYARTIHDIVGPALTKPMKEPAPTEKKADPTLSKFVGRYTAPLGSERQVLIIDGELAILSLPTDNPQRSLIKLRRVQDNVFRQVRPDGVEVGPVVFEVGSDGRATRFEQENQFSYRVN